MSRGNKRNEFNFYLPDPITVSFLGTPTTGTVSSFTNYPGPLELPSLGIIGDTWEYSAAF